MSQLVLQTEHDRVALARILEPLAEPDECSFEIFRMHKVETRPPDQFFGRIAKVGCDRLALVNDLALFIEQCKQVGRLFNKGAEALLALTQRPLGAQVLRHISPYAQNRGRLAIV